MYVMFVGAQATSKLDCGLCMTEVIFLKHLPICKICRSSHGFSSAAKPLRITGTGGYCVRTYCAEIYLFPNFLYFQCLTWDVVNQSVIAGLMVSRHATFKGNCVRGTQILTRLANKYVGFVFI